MDNYWYAALHAVRDLLSLLISVFPPQGERWFSLLFDKWAYALVAQPIPGTPESLGQFFGLWAFTLGIAVKTIWGVLWLIGTLLRFATEAFDAWATSGTPQSPSAAEVEGEQNA